MKIIKFPGVKTWKYILKRAVADNADIRNDISLVINDIKHHGDEALRKYTLQFDKVDLESFLVPENEIADAVIKVDDKLKNAIIIAKENIEIFHRNQLIEPKVIETTRCAMLAESCTNRKGRYICARWLCTSFFNSAYVGGPCNDSRL